MNSNDEVEQAIKRAPIAHSAMEQPKNITQCNYKNEVTRGLTKYMIENFNHTWWVIHHRDKSHDTISIPMELMFTVQAFVMGWQAPKII